jgi:hypothetical protein
LKREVSWEPFDLVYAAGILDYLPDALARGLCAALRGLLRPGGELLVANFLPGSKSTGYMEAFLDWWLLYRTPEALLSLLPLDSPGSRLSRSITVDTLEGGSSDSLAP